MFNGDTEGWIKRSWKKGLHSSNPDLKTPALLLIRVGKSDSPPHELYSPQSPPMLGTHSYSISPNTTGKPACTDLPIQAGRPVLILEKLYKIRQQRILPPTPKAVIAPEAPVVKMNLSVGRTGRKGILMLTSWTMQSIRAWPYILTTSVPINHYKSCITLINN